MKSNKGVTLVALVITIIVLIILAAVAIATLTGDNGIIRRAQQSRDDTEIANAVEDINTGLNSLKVDYTAAIVNGESVTLDKTYVLNQTGLKEADYSISVETSGTTTTVTIGVASAKSFVNKVDAGTFVVSSANQYGVITGAKKHV